MEFGGIEPGKVGAWHARRICSLDSIVEEVPGFHTSTDVGSLVNFQGMYSLNKWLLVGMMLEWERHSMSEETSNTDLGHQDTVSVLPTVEVRPVKFGPVIPYANMSFGVNVNSFGESSAIGTTISPSNNFAWRLRLGRRLHAHKTVRAEHGNGLQAQRWSRYDRRDSCGRLERLFLRLPLRRQTLLLVSEYSRQVERRGTSVLWRVPRQIR